MSKKFKQYFQQRKERKKIISQMLYQVLNNQYAIMDHYYNECAKNYSSRYTSYNNSMLRRSMKLLENRMNETEWLKANYISLELKGVIKVKDGVHPQQNT